MRVKVFAPIVGGTPVSMVKDVMSGLREQAAAAAEQGEEEDEEEEEEEQEQQQHFMSRAWAHINPLRAGDVMAYSCDP